MKLAYVIFNFKNIVIFPAVRITFWCWVHIFGPTYTYVHYQHNKTRNGKKARLFVTMKSYKSMTAWVASNNGALT